MHYLNFIIYKISEAFVKLIICLIILTKNSVTVTSWILVCKHVLSEAVAETT